jgi:putative phosphotransacetylase
MSTQPALDRSVVERLVRELVTERMQTRSTAPTLVVHASARHMHLCRGDLVKLFGEGRELMPLRDLHQAGNYAAQETVTLIGPRSRLISNLRILGPLRDRSQIELALTDAISLGIDDIPIRLSGDIAGTPGALVMGPAGVVELSEGVIRAAMHVHMNPAEAEYLGVKHKDIVKLRVGGDAATCFERVHVRVDPKARLNVHMDTDEANACGLHRAREIELIGANGRRAFAVIGPGGMDGAS